MAHDFWDVLSFSTVMAVRDWNRDNQRRKERAAKFYQKCSEEIADSASYMFEVISSVWKKANPAYIPEEINQGIMTLPAYAFLRVLQAQGGTSTPEQTKVLNIFFNSLGLSFSKNEFIAAARSQNATRQSIEDLVGVSDSRAGRFWQTFFKAMYKTNSDESTLSELIKHFSSIVMRFSILGMPESEAALPICEEFINSVHMQIIECRNLPEKDLDFIGETTAAEHFDRMRNLSIDLVGRAGDQDELDIEQLFILFSIGILYYVVDHTTRNVSDQANMLDFAMDLSGIQMDMSGYEIIKEMQAGSEFGSLINNLYTLNDEASMNFLKLLLIVSQKSQSGDEVFKFMKEATGYLSGIEAELAREYSFSGLGKIGLKYMMDAADEIAELVG